MDLKEINDWADFWRDHVGMNVIPADSINKTTSVSWKNDSRGNWQVDPIPKYIHDEWKESGAFKNGMAVICGLVHHNEKWKGKYLCAIDADNLKGIQCMSKRPITEIAQETLVEQHPDNPNKAHYYFYTTRPMPKKSSDAVNLELFEKMKSNEAPALEMKGQGTHGIMYCTPSPHKGGTNYTILGTTTPRLFDDIGKVINTICDDYSLGRDNTNRVSMKLLLKDETIVLEGSNRHEALMRYAERILRKYPYIMEEQIFRDCVLAKNKRMCQPPLSEQQVDEQIKCAVRFIEEQVERDEALRKIEGNKFGTPQFWEDVKQFTMAYHPTGMFIRCIDCDRLIEPNPMERIHYGHTTELVKKAIKA